jgi:hypothetical protein
MVPAWRSRAHDEQGVALVTVLLISMIMLIIVAGTMSYALGSMPISRRDQDWSAALAAAEAGIDDYLFRLNENDQYYLYGNPAGSPAKPAPPDGNKAFTQWVPVPGASASTTCPAAPTNVPCFRYTADTTNLVAQGAIILSATGRVNKVTRVVQTTLRRKAFIDYLYFTDYETFDPATYTGSPFTPAEAQAACSFHRFDGRDPSCWNIYFQDADTINGPLHTNDALGICGDPTFNGAVTTSWSTSPPRYFVGGSGCSGSSPNFQPGDPKYADPLTMPPSNAAIRADADQTQGGTGCLFTGPTQITLNSNGTMSVVSPFTKWPATPNNCQPGTNIPLPANGVIYVQNVPSTSSDPNYTSGCITSTQINGSSTVNHPLGYPQRYDITTYGCRNGDVFLQGILKGRLTIAAENNIDVVGNTTYQGGTGGSDLLGLISNNYVEIYHPVGDSSAPSSCRSGSSYGGYYNLERFSCSSTAFANPIVQAALLSVNHSFRVQNYQYGEDNLGNITLNGAIAQRYRGPVALIGASGYGKNYNYDQRLKYQSPPRFLQPVAAAWQVVTWIEQAPTNGVAWNVSP